MSIFSGHLAQQEQIKAVGIVAPTSPLYAGHGEILGFSDLAQTPA